VDTPAVANYETQMARVTSDSCGDLNQRTYLPAVKAVAWIVVAWATVRLLLACMIGIHSPSPRNGDVWDFIALALAVSDHGNFLGAQTQFQRDPGYPLLLAGMLWMGWQGVYALQSLMTLMTALFVNRRLGFWSGISIAACPFFPIFEWALLSEVASVTALCCGWLLAFYPKRGVDVAAGGLLLGIAAALRMPLLPVCVAALVIVIIRYKRPKKIISFALAAVAPVALSLGIPDVNRSRIGFQLWIGTWERDPAWMNKSISDFPPYAFTTYAERQRLLAALPTHDDSAFLGAALQRLRSDPGFVLGSWVKRYPYLWIGTRTESTSPNFPRFSIPWYAFKTIMFGLNVLVLTAGLIAGFSALWRRDRSAELLVPIACVGLVYLPFHNVEIRYSLPAMPFLLILCTRLAGERRQWSLHQDDSAKVRHAVNAASLDATG
jgi:hypothetical protein